MRLISHAFSSLFLLPHPISALVYITNLPAYSSLAPCAQYAVSYQVSQINSNNCPSAGITATESCACTQDQNSLGLQSKISSYVLYTCGKTATEDVDSASIVFSAYCNQGGTVLTASPGKFAVTQYITDLSAYSDLAPCATSALSGAVMGVSNSICPSNAGPSAMASCVCSKNLNGISAYVNEKITTSMKYECGSTHTEDITSAQAVLAGYCGLANGTTSFPSLSYLPGAVSYYITALTEYSNLPKCAQSAVSYPVMGQTSYDCRSNPMALVSCLCVKDQNYEMMTGKISSSASLYCGSTASENLASAMGVFDFYCSVGKGLATVGGKIAGVSTTAYTTKAATGTTGSNKGTSTGKYSSGAATSTSDSSSGDGTSDGSTLDSSTTLSTKKGGAPVGTIVGAVVGSVVFICIVLFGAWKYRSHKLRKNQPHPIMVESHPHGSAGFGKAELPSSDVKAVPMKTSVSRKPVGTAPVVPVGAVNLRRNGNPSGTFSDISTVGSGTPVHELHPQSSQYEVDGSGTGQYPVEMGASLSGPFEIGEGYNHR